ncbi:MAG: hydrogenase maturation protease [Actinobacteria bacterium]|nr:hydrogenase maturation protease [Actinomycetota bacterium]
MLVGGVGYRNLRDGSLGNYVADTLQSTDEIEIEDLSYGPVAVSHNLRDRPPYDRLVLVAAVGRGREPGTVERYRWDGALPLPDEIQERVGEAVTGVISLDNLLVVCGAFGGLPDDVRVVEVEPADENWGEGFSEAVRRRLPEIVEAVWTSTEP